MVKKVTTDPDPTENVLALVAAANLRQDDLRIAESTHVRELMEIRDKFAAQTRTQETERINAIRSVDVDAVARAAEVSEARASTLAAQVAQSAETLRGQVAAAATASAVSLAAALEPIQKSIDDLRRAQYEQVGQAAKSVEGRSTNQWVIGAIFAAIGTLIAIISIVIVLTTH